VLVLCVDRGRVDEVYTIPASHALKVSCLTQRGGTHTDPSDFPPRPNISSSSNVSAPSHHPHLGRPNLPKLPTKNSNLRCFSRRGLISQTGYGQMAVRPPNCFGPRASNCLLRCSITANVRFPTIGTRLCESSSSKLDHLRPRPPPLARLHPLRRRRRQQQRGVQRRHRERGLRSKPSPR
jgi:hypothetical protein